MKKSVLKSLILLVPVITQAQVDLQNTGVLYSSNASDILYINGNFTNTSAASLTNNGNMYVLQNLVNDQSFGAIGTGTLYLNGTAAQAVNGTQTFKTYNLVTNNGAGITINNNLSVTGSHVFTSGLITTSATPNYLIYEAGSSYSGDNDSRHVNGWVKKFGNTSFVFPVGDATYERTIQLSSLSASSEFNVSYKKPTPNALSVLSPLIVMDAAEYWPVTKISGGTAKATLNWDNSKVAFPNWVLSGIVVAGYNGSLWTDQGGGGTATGNVMTTGSVTSSSMSSFNLVGFGSKAFPIPLKLISFTAQKENRYILLSWITENEASVSHFTIEKSTDGKSFAPFTEVPARNSGNRETYSVNDSTGLPAIIYYRLKSVDIDGKFSYSNIIIIKSSDSAEGLFLINNPVHDNIIIRVQQKESIQWNVQIHTSSGQLVSKQYLATTGNGYYRLPINTELAAGIYFLTLTGGDKQYNFRVVKN
ncbi:MAG: T9SS type A sorting domain-containing protein [Bacteroidetes bacterium]|nr:T9SS type A sorting domain-containing protein [Bacteroidota bacterium]